MIEESNIRAIKKYHGKMSKLDIDYYLSIGSGRYYKDYLDKENVYFNRKCIKDFLLDDKMYNQCVSDIYNVLEIMKNVNAFVKRKVYHPTN